MEFIRTADQLLDILHQLDPEGCYKELYKDRSGGWGITHTHDIMINPEAVTDLLARRVLYPTYRNSNACYWLGSLSIDIDYIVERRKIDRNFGLVYYDNYTGKRIHEDDIKNTSYPRSLTKFVSHVANRRMYVTCTDKAVTAYNLYKKHGNMRTVAKILGCTHQNISRLVNQYRKFHNVT